MLVGADFVTPGEHLRDECEQLIDGMKSRGPVRGDVFDLALHPPRRDVGGLQEVNDESRLRLPTLHEHQQNSEAAGASHRVVVKLRLRAGNSVSNERRIHFAPFALDLINECLWRGSRVIKLRPKAFAVLEHLVSRPGQLVTKEHLISAVWKETFVGDTVLKVAIQQIRNALSDDPKAPRFIETAHRRGYRFIGEISAIVEAAEAREERDAGGTAGSLSLQLTNLPAGFVGREHALLRLQAWLEKARLGESQVVFVTGEAGIGKTTLLEAFLRSVVTARTVRICSGQCLEQYGMSEAYLPVLDAIRQLCRDDAEAVEVLRTHAPMWLMQMPSLVTPADRELFGREAIRGTPERMLREMAEALDALAVHAPLVLVLEDLHWSDFSTLDLISYVARRRRAARLMLVGTYRPAELIAGGHPLKRVKQELAARQQCEELPLEYLTKEAVGQHLAARFPANRFPADLVALIHERTEGNPLFMVNTINHLISEGLIARQDDGWQSTAPIDAIKLGVPDSIRQLIETLLDRLDARDQLILEAASVAGTEFPALAVAAALDDDIRAVEIRCEELSKRGQFIRECGAQFLPSGQAVGRFAFLHALYRHVLYERISTSRRIQLHRRVGQRGEELYGERVGEMAAELAMHFEQATDYARAARYLQQSAVNALHRSAYHEAIVLSRQGLGLLATLPDSDERARQELSLHITLGVPLIATEGYAAPEVRSVYLEARELCERLGTPPEISQVLWGLWTFHTLKAELSTALDIAGEFLRLAERVPHPGVAMRGHWAMEITNTHLGHFSAALQHFDKALSLYDPRAHRDLLADALNPGVAMRCFAGWCLWFIGHPDRALVRMQEAVALARDLSEPHGLAHALVFAAVLHQLRRERELAQRHADEAIALAAEHGLVFYGAMAQILRGWALTGLGDDVYAAEQMRQGLATWQGTGAQLLRPYFLALLAEASQSTGEDHGLGTLDQALALAESTGERFCEAEIYRLRGEQLLRDTPESYKSGNSNKAEACFEQALAIARRQEALSLQLRAALGLARLHQHRAQHVLARNVILPIYERFEEGFDTVDLGEARDLLDLFAER
jgi:DNA-binding winged helix-turn-helix (wHTH) protein/tetratricopeptide (TPR) repeat protein